MRSPFFDIFGAINTVNIDVFGASEAQNPFTVFFVAKIAVFTMVFDVFASGLAKKMYLRSFQHVASRTFSMPKAQKHCKLQCFSAWQAAKRQQKSAKKCPK